MEMQKTNKNKTNLCWSSRTTRNMLYRISYFGLIRFSLVTEVYGLPVKASMSKSEGD